jgi:hypothetical protein
MHSKTRRNGPGMTPAGRETFDQFLQDRDLLERLRVTEEELEALSHCAFLGAVSSKQDFLFVLRQVRGGAIAPSESSPLHPPSRRTRRQSSRAAKRFLGNPDERRSAACEPAITPAVSLAKIIRHRRIEQIGCMAGGLLLIAYLWWGLFGPLLSRQERLLGALHRVEAESVEPTDSMRSPR